MEQKLRKKEVFIPIGLLCYQYLIFSENDHKVTYEFEFAIVPN